jgi:(p)ppGpp synthase/HD superfamily hydrolase
MESKIRTRQVNQQELRLHIEHNMDLITEIFKMHKEDDYKGIISSLIEDVFKKADPSLCLSYEPVSGYARENKLRNSLEFAIKKHLGQFRDSGAAYVTHPIQCGYIAAELGLGEDIVVSLNLHDIPEENQKAVMRVLDEIRIRFDKKIRYYTSMMSIYEEVEEKDEIQVNNLWRAFSLTNNIELLYLKPIDTTDNLYTKKDMHKKNGMTAEERQRKFELKAERNILPMTRFIDRTCHLDLHFTSYMQELIHR